MPEPNKPDALNEPISWTTLNNTTPQVTVFVDAPPEAGVVLLMTGVNNVVTSTHADPVVSENSIRVTLGTYQFRFKDEDRTLALFTGAATDAVGVLVPSYQEIATRTGDASSTTPTVTTPPLSTTPSPTSMTGVQPSRIAGNSTSKQLSDDSDISPGAVAGAAIGSFIAGALIAGLILWFCLGKNRKSRRGRDHESSMLALVPGQEKGPAAKVVSVASASPVSRDINGILPQPLEDEAISSGISGIGVAIKNHVQSFYHSNRVSPALLDLDDLQRLGSDLPLSTGTLSTILGNSDTREVALRFCIGWVVVSRMQLSHSSGTTFLPPEVAECFRSMAIGNHASQSQMSYLAKWRGLTAELMQSTYVKNPFTRSDSRQRSIENALNALDGILLPFADPRMDNTERTSNLREIVKRAATFAFTLFSQPSTWEFDWQRQQQGGLSGGLCVFPAFVQVTDESSGTVRPPRVVSEAIVRSLD